MIVVDANVILSALRSSRGASHRLLRSLLLGEIECAVSPAIALEYEDVLKRPGVFDPHPWISPSEIDVVLDALLGCARLVSPFFRFRPFLADPADDLYIECALAAGADIIVSRDKHFRHPALSGFGLTAMRPGELLALDAKRRRRS